jgi:pyruvate kinase
MVKAGVDVVRLNFSHGDVETHRERARAVREYSRQFGRHVGVLADLQGPKIRIARFKGNGKVCLEEKARFDLDVNLEPEIGDNTQVGVCYRELPHDVKPGDVLLLDDGRIVLKVNRIEGSRIICEVVIGGELSNHKGINKQGGGLSAKALSEKDKEDIKTAVEIEADYIAVSFPRTAADMHEARALLRAAGGDAGVIAKIERAEALDALDEIIEASDSVMVARGDLGVEIGDANLPKWQKEIIKRARAKNRAVITATQMMESMIQSPLPTRAEVFDVANAVIDGTDAVMLSAETATGKYPVRAVAAMDRVCLEAEKHPAVRMADKCLEEPFTRVDETIAISAMYAANHLPVRAIAALTESGSTPICMSRISSGIPIYAMTGHEKTCRKVTLYRGVYPLTFYKDTSNHAELNRAVIEEFLDREIVRVGDLIIITEGDLTGMRGGTNQMKIARVNPPGSAQYNFS